MTVIAAPCIALRTPTAYIAVVLRVRIRGSLVTLRECRLKACFRHRVTLVGISAAMLQGRRLRGILPALISGRPAHLPSAKARRGSYRTERSRSRRPLELPASNTTRFGRRNWQAPASEIEGVGIEQKQLKDTADAMRAGVPVIVRAALRMVGDYGRRWPRARTDLHLPEGRAASGLVGYASLTTSSVPTIWPLGSCQNKAMSKSARMPSV
jgi:hypothetical protein